MKIGIIGEGAIGHYVAENLRLSGVEVAAFLTRAHHFPKTAKDGILRVDQVQDLPPDIKLMVDCAGHQGLAQHGAAILRRGVDLITLSVGALADPVLADELSHAAKSGGAQLHLASGAIGALDSLRAAAVGGLTGVTYTGRKPPKGWKGSPAEDQLDLETLAAEAVHFNGSAREAALAYPKNANVAAAVALAGVGFDQTQVTLIADPSVTANIHEIHAQGAFGEFSFRIKGGALPDNPRSSALAAMSAVAAVIGKTAPIAF